MSDVRSGTNLGFIIQDVETQRSVAQDIINQIRFLDAQIAIAPSPLKEQLMAMRQNLLISANRLADNADTTSATATTIWTEVLKKTST